MSTHKDFYSDLVYVQTFGSEGNTFLPDEITGTPTMYILKSGSWKEVSSMYILKSGSWKTITDTNVIKNGGWI